tara:strand:- start:1287 stop:2453 length:1167 start_codon:yes stop_codon:yes gene_type:complete
MCASGQLGGTELRMLEEARFLRTLGYDAIVAVKGLEQETHGRAYRDLLRDSDIPIIALNPPAIMTDWRKRHVHWLRAEALTRWQLRRLQLDLVHVFFPWTNQGLDHLWLAGRCHVPSIISVHNAFPRADFSSWHRHHLGIAFRSLRGVYGVSKTALEHFDENFREYYPGTIKQDVIFNFVDLQRFQPSSEKRLETRMRLGIPPEVPLIGSVGRLDKQKQPLSLVEVFSRVKAILPDARLLLIGEGSMQKVVENRIEELNLADSVTILPFQSNIECIFPALDVHLLTSRNEGFGIVTAEAMACGIPVVGTRVTGTEEVIGDCEAGRLVPLGDSGVITNAVLEFLFADMQEKQRLSQLARAHVQAHFSKGTWECKVEAFYLEALSCSTLS